MIHDINSLFITQNEVDFIAQETRVFRGDSLTHNLKSMDRAERYYISIRWVDHPVCHLGFFFVEITTLFIENDRFRNVPIHNISDTDKDSWWEK